MTCGISFTFGGPWIDAKVEALKIAHRFIPDLFAAGELVEEHLLLRLSRRYRLDVEAVFGRLAGDCCRLGGAQSGRCCRSKPQCGKKG